MRFFQNMFFSHAIIDACNISNYIGNIHYYDNIRGVPVDGPKNAMQSFKKINNKYLLFDGLANFDCHLDQRYRPVELARQY
jgi:hypothetical protein